MNFYDYFWIIAQLKYWLLCSLTGKWWTVYRVKEITSLLLLSFEDSPFQGRNKPAPALEMESKDLSWDHWAWKSDKLNQNSFFILNIFTAEF